MNILLVDDDRFIIEALREKINWDKLHIDIVYVAYSLTQAQNIIREHPIALMISDIECLKVVASNSYRGLEMKNMI